MEFDEEIGILATNQSDRFRLDIAERAIPATDSERLAEIKAKCEAYLASLGARSYQQLEPEERDRQRHVDLASAEWAAGVQNVIDMAQMISGTTESYGFRR